MIIILLVLLITLGLFGAVCGGFFTVSFILSPGGDYNLYIISIPSFLIGLLFVFLGYKGIKKVKNRFNQN